MEKEFLEKSKQIHEDKYDYSLVKYINSKTNVEIICKEHGVFPQTPGKHIRGQGCPICGKIKNGISQRSNTDIFIEKAIQKHKNKYDYSLVLYQTSKIKIKIVCPIHGVWEQAPYHHLSGKGCRKCSGYAKLTNDQFILKSSQVHNNKYNYSLSIYQDHYTKVKIICPKHGEFSQGAGSHMSGIGCPNCNESKGENIIFNYLVANKIPFERQKTFEGCVHKYRLRFDFYLSQYNTCIEYDGEQHFTPVTKWGGQANLNLILKRDHVKNEFCIKNNIKLIRLTSKDNIITVLSSILYLL